jgi:TorA maturation chaperone TorD
MNIAIIADTLGHLFYNPPNHEHNIQLMTILNQPTSSMFDDLVIAWQKTNPQALAHDFTHLFEKRDTMPLPPYGSVYLDKERRLFGESTSRYCNFLQQQGESLTTDQHEPEDHIGLMLLTIARLAKEKNNDAIKQLVSDHLLTWAGYYLMKLQQSATMPFYQTLAYVTLDWLFELHQLWQIAIPPVTHYPLHDECHG